MNIMRKIYIRNFEDLSSVGSTWEILKNPLKEFVFTACLSIMAAFCHGNMGIYTDDRISQRGGLVYLSALQAIVQLQGVQGNPALSIASYMAGYLAIIPALMNILAQFSGSYIAYGSILYFMPPSVIYHQRCQVPLGIPLENKFLPPHIKYLMQFMITLIVILGWLTILKTRRHQMNISKIVQVFLISMCTALSIVLTGDGLNMAWIFGPAQYHKYIRGQEISLVAQISAIVVAVSIRKIRNAQVFRKIHNIITYFGQMDLH